MYTTKAVEMVKKVVFDYVNGVVDFDFQLGESAWHPQGLKLSLDSDKNQIIAKTILQTRPSLDLDEIEEVKEKISQEGAIESVDVTGDTASVKLVWDFKKEGNRKKITDYILLLNCCKGWKIVGKISNEESL